MKNAYKPRSLTPPDRLPVELQDSLGFRFLTQLPSGPMRDSVEGYLGMPEDKRGAGTFAHKIVVAAVRAEQERQRQVRRAVSRFVDIPTEREPDLGASIRIPETDGGGELEAIPPSRSTERDGRVRFEFDESPANGHPPGPELRVGSSPGGNEQVRPGERVERPQTDPGPVAWRRPDPEPAGAPVEPPPPIAAEPSRHFRSRDARRAVAGEPRGWSTSFAELDRCGLEFVPGRLYLVHGPPGGGRTAFLLELLRRYAEGHGGAVYASGTASRSDVFVRLLVQETGRHDPSSPHTTPVSDQTVRTWLREPTGVAHIEADRIGMAAQRLDDLATHGGLDLIEGPTATEPFAAWSSSLVERSVREGPSLVLLDDASDLGGGVPKRTPESEADMTRLIRRLTRIARGEGHDSAVPVVFSVPFPPTGETSSRLGAVLRVDAPPSACGCLVSVEKNALGPRGGAVEIQVFGTKAPG